MTDQDQQLAILLTCSHRQLCGIAYAYGTPINKVDKLKQAFLILQKLEVDIVVTYRDDTDPPINN